MRIEIWTFSFQICFRNKFLTLGSGQSENTQICVFAYFKFDHFPKLKIDSEGRFEMKISIFLFLKSFGLYLKKSRVRETKNLSTDANRRTDTILGRLRDYQL